MNVIRVALGLIVVGVLSLLLAPVSYAGGWAVVTLDSLPAEIHAGQQYQLGMMVRQHGVTPISKDPFTGGALSVRVMASHDGQKENIELQARPEGELGHFVADITFPSAGTWAWSAQPGQFQATELGTISVLPAVSARLGQPASQLASPWLWLAILCLCGSAGMLLLARRRDKALAGV